MKPAPTLRTRLRPAPLGPLRCPGRETAPGRARCKTRRPRNAGNFAPPPLRRARYRGPSSSSSRTANASGTS
eukprot:11163335-Lingulodinium_polyedra.AAC.1